MANAMSFDSSLSPDPVIFPPDFISKFQKLSKGKGPKNFKSTLSKNSEDKILPHRTTLPRSKNSKKRFNNRDTLFWVGLIGASIYAGYKVYEHNNQKPSPQNLVVPTTEIRSF